MPTTSSTVLQPKPYQEKHQKYGQAENQMWDTSMCLGAELLHTSQSKDAHKLDPTTIACIMVGYPENSVGYRLWNPTIESKSSYLEMYNSRKKCSHSWQHRPTNTTHTQPFTQPTDIPGPASSSSNHRPTTSSTQEQVPIPATSSSTPSESIQHTPTTELETSQEDTSRTDTLLDASRPQRTRRPSALLRSPDFVCMADTNGEKMTLQSPAPSQRWQGDLLVGITGTGKQQSGPNFNHMKTIIIHGH